MTGATTRSRPTAARRAGFTLLEVMTAMILTAVVLMSVVSLLLSQVRYVSQINGDVHALDQVNAAQGMLAAEFATLTRGSVQFAGADSVAVYLPLSWGIVCGPLDRHLKSSSLINKKTKTGATSPTVSNTAALTLEADPSDLGSPTPDGFALSPGGATYTYYSVPSWSTMGLVRSDTTAASACMRSAPSSKTVKIDPKKALLAPVVTTTILGPIDEYASSTGLKTVVGDMPDERTLMLTYLRVSYFFRNDGSGRSLYRSSKAGTAKLAGPFTSSAQFAYRLADGSSSTSIAAGNLPNIRAIRPTLAAIRAKRGKVKADTLDVRPWLYLFNAQ